MDLQDRGVYKHAGFESKGASAQILRVFFLRSFLYEFKKSFQVISVFLCGLSSVRGGEDWYQLKSSLLKLKILG